MDEITDKDGLDPFKIISMDIFSTRHLFRLPYSLHEKSLLVSLPIKPSAVDKFEKSDAEPEKVKIEETFLKHKTERHDFEGFIIEALDWSAKYKIEPHEPLPKMMQAKKMRLVTEEYFPPCMQNIFKGLADGRKRSVFVLINFMRNMGWDLERMEVRLREWNEKNYPPMRANYLRTQLRWHMRQSRSLLPPNCDNPNFYTNYKVCTPDATCTGGTDRITLKNPVNYPFRKLKFRDKSKKLRKKPYKKR
jgi:DNA primase large subunit